MRKTLRTLTVVSLLAAPMALAAQGAARRPAGPGGPGAPGAQMVRRGPQDPGVTQILNARRVLDLSPRQVAQLDSIERALYTERRAMQQRARALTDSVRTAARTRAEQNQGRVPDAQRDSIRESVRTRMQSLRPQMERLRERASVSRAAALRVLNDAQRQQLREIQAEERGRQRGMMEARMRQRGGAMRPGARGNARDRRERETEARQRMERRRPDARPEDGAPGI